MKSTEYTLLKTCEKPPYLSEEFFLYINKTERPVVVNYLLQNHSQVFDFILFVRNGEDRRQVITHYALNDRKIDKYKWHSFWAQAELVFLDVAMQRQVRIEETFFQCIEKMTVSSACIQSVNAIGGARTSCKEAGESDALWPAEKYSESVSHTSDTEGCQDDSDSIKRALFDKGGDRKDGESVSTYSPRQVDNGEGRSRPGQIEETMIFSNGSVKAEIGMEAHIGGGWQAEAKERTANLAQKIEAIAQAPEWGERKKKDKIMVVEGHTYQGIRYEQAGSTKNCITPAKKGQEQEILTKDDPEWGEQSKIKKAATCNIAPHQEGHPKQTVDQGSQTEQEGIEGEKTKHDAAGLKQGGPHTVSQHNKRILEEKKGGDVLREQDDLGREDKPQQKIQASVPYEPDSRHQHHQEVSSDSHQAKDDPEERRQKDTCRDIAANKAYCSQVVEGPKPDKGHGEAARQEEVGSVQKNHNQSEKDKEKAPGHSPSRQKNPTVEPKKREGGKAFIYHYVRSPKEKNETTPTGVKPSTWKEGGGGRKALGWCKGLLLTLNTIVVRKVLIIQLSKTAMKAWTIQWVAFSAPLVCACCLWIAMTWQEKKWFDSPRGQSISSIKARIIRGFIVAIDRGKKCISFQEKKKEVLQMSYLPIAKNPKVLDDFGIALERKYRKSQASIPKEEQQSVVLSLYDDKKRYTLAMG